MKVWVLNGPNLGQLGIREPAIYGTATYDDLVASVTAAGTELGVEVDVRQTDDEATMFGWLHTASAACDAVILNPAAWTHTSVALRDACASLTVPFIEVHLSNPLAREEFRHTSYTVSLAKGMIAGFGQDSYVLALRALVSGS